MNRTVLFVDDEPHVLSSIRRQLYQDFDVLTAPGGSEALQLLAEAESVAVVVSDMRMPGMSGAQLLEQVAESFPFTTRMILSGQSDLDSAIAAINQGHIFRFITKPTDADTLKCHVKAAIEQYELVTTKEELLEKTLQSLVETLNEILGLTNPVAHQRTLRVSSYVRAISHALQFDMPWELRLAALLSQVGCVNLPPQVLAKVYRAETLTADEQEQYAFHPQLAAQLIGRIPQLDAVGSMIEQQHELQMTDLPSDFNLWSPEQISVAVLATAARLDEFMAVGHGPAEALERLLVQLPGLPEPLVTALRAVHLRTASMAIRYVPSNALTLGMVVDQDILSANGEVLLTRGSEVAPANIDTLRERKLATEQSESDGLPLLRVLIPA